ncbi:MAG: 3-deoxy-D-manno-octulosonic acid transferase [Deltaproteobacteria bacterium]|nr:MAG: 3-deoxy-D-manno-octulosonic acid transferase [Deltaproteobacteria bacterium]
MANKLLIKIGLWLYNLIWSILLPFLRLNRRLAEGFDQRTLRYSPQPADLWIQAASAGEAYLARELLEALHPFKPVRIHMTTNTRQGLEILEGAVGGIDTHKNIVSVSAAYFPFDHPTIMKNAVKSIQPRTMVLLESEMWPGLLAALKKYNCKTLIINGRITARSLSRYLWWSSLWRSIKPHKILAISEDDARRFSVLFGNAHVAVMSNIKFDRFDHDYYTSEGKNPLEKIIPPATPFLVLGSIRQEEESQIEKIITNIYQKNPEPIIGLFPRHIHRVKYWQDIFNRTKRPFVLRSRINQNIADGTVILWNTFGELSQAYALSTAAFVGGSLAPLGGQNFLEPLSCGVLPVIGPSWENFAWVGTEIVKEGLIRVAADWMEVADALLSDLNDPKDRETVSEAAFKYIRDRQGGAVRAAQIIAETLNNP